MRTRIDVDTFTNIVSLVQRVEQLHRECRRNVGPLISRPLVVGVLNVTPDSFSDGGLFLNEKEAYAHIDRLIEEGADILEVGGESTRPAGKVYGVGHIKIDAPTQIKRVLPAIQYAAQRGSIKIAIDTTRAEVAHAALDAGATLVNDVSLLSEPRLATLCAEYNAWLVLMHTREGADSYSKNVLQEIGLEWTQAHDRAVHAGLSTDRIIFDPGIGFGKNATHNFWILKNLASFSSLQHPIYIGLSRKAFLAEAEKLLNLAPSAPNLRDPATTIACLWAIRAGAHLVRVHNVRALYQALAFEHAIQTTII